MFLVKFKPFNVIAQYYQVLDWCLIYYICNYDIIPKLKSPRNINKKRCVLICGYPSKSNCSFTGQMPQPQSSHQNRLYFILMHTKTFKLLLNLFQMYRISIIFERFFQVIIANFLNCKKVEFCNVCNLDGQHTIFCVSVSNFYISCDISYIQLPFGIHRVLYLL